MRKSIFEGIKVLDLTWIATGPFTSRYLSNHGSTVVHVESATRPDILRVSQPFKDRQPGIDRSGWWADYNSDKYSLALNLTREKARPVLIKLLRWCDIFLENFAPGVIDKWGASYEEARKLNPSIIMLSANMQGNTGPHAEHPGLGTNLAGLSGFYEVIGWPDRPPVYGYGAFTDFMAPSLGISAICAALIRREKTGKGEYIELSQFECGMQGLTVPILDYTVNKRIAGRLGNRSPYHAPYGVYRCNGKERWCSIAVTTEQEWRKFCEALGWPQWTKEKRFNSVADRKRNEDELDRLVEEWTSRFSANEVMFTLQEKGVPAGIVSTAADLFDDAQLRHRKYFRYIRHPVIGKHAYQSYGFRFSKTPAKFEMPAPCLGEHTAYVCTELLGMSDQEFAELFSEDVFQ